MILEQNEADNIAELFKHGQSELAVILLKSTGINVNDEMVSNWKADDKLTYPMFMFTMSGKEGSDSPFTTVWTLGDYLFIKYTHIRIFYPNRHPTPRSVSFSIRKGDQIIHSQTSIDYNNGILDNIEIVNKYLKLLIKEYIKT